MSWSEFISMMTDAELILKKGGFWTLLLIVFLENGVIVGVFLPGDYLLVLAGVYCNEYLHVNIYVLSFSIWFVTILGTYLGYVTGEFSGKKFLQKDTWLVKHKHIVLTRAYFIKFGGRTLAISKFLPYVRTLAPMLSGVVEMPLKRVFNYTIIGSTLWVLIFTVGGYYLGAVYPGVKSYMHYLVAVLITMSTSVVVISYLRGKSKRRKVRT